MIEQRNVPIELLYRDPLNPRDELPTDNLVDSLKKVGLKDPITVRPSNNNGSYYVTNGWGRTQAALKAGYTEIPCEIHPDKLSAMKAGRANSIVREWTKYNHITHINNYYEVCREKGMGKEKAIERTVSDNDSVRSTVERYIRVWTLPDFVKLLLKQPKKRTAIEWDILLKHNKNIRRHTSPLHITIADYLVTYGSDVSEWKLLDIATNVVGKKVYDAKTIIREACRKHNSEKPIRDIINSIETGCNESVVLNLPNTIVLPPDEKEIILEYVTKRRITMNQFLRRLFTDFVNEERSDE